MTGCLFQIYKICENYFAFETNAFVKYEDEDKISLPAITVYIYNYFLLKEKYLSRFKSKEKALNYIAIDVFK
jgi:hypothetical protein